MRRLSAIPPIAAALLACCLSGSPTPAQEPPVQLAAESTDAASHIRVRALVAMEALREEIVTLAALRDAQAALLSWNRESTKTGAPAQALPAGLCRDRALAAWCSLLPATFGAPWTEDGHDRN